MALPNYYKFHIYNDTGVTLDFSVDDTLSITAIPWKRDSNGALEYGTKITLMSTPGSDVADAAMAEGSELDNTSNKYEGLWCIAELVSDDSPDGNLLIYWEWSQGDAAADTYPSDAPDFDAARMDTDLTLAAILVCEGASDDRISTNFEIR